MSVINVPLSPYVFTTVFLNHQGRILSRLPAEAWGFIENLGNNIILEMIEVPGGTFKMGSPPAETEREKNEGPQHNVTVKGFVMSKYEITQAQWRAVANLKKVKIDLNPDPSKLKGDQLPVDSISWEEAIEFCERLSLATGHKYRLPSEAEWEYACRAGTVTPFYLGETITTEYVNYDGTYPYRSAPKRKYRQSTVPVGSLDYPNRFGLFDMHGNVSEWCADRWMPNYNGAPIDGSAWITNTSIDYRVVRGGNWFKQARDARSSSRDYFPNSNRSYSVGIRVVAAP